MNVLPIQDVSFDDEATHAMGAAFDKACVSLRHLACADKVRELIANRIIEAAINGERDPTRLHSQVLFGAGIDDLSIPVASVGHTAPSPAYATVAHAA